MKIPVKKSESEFTGKREFLFPLISFPLPAGPVSIAHNCSFKGFVLCVKCFCFDGYSPVCIVPNCFTCNHELFTCSIHIILFSMRELTRFRSPAAPTSQISVAALEQRLVGFSCIIFMSMYMIIISDIHLDLDSSQHLIFVTNHFFIL